MTSSHSILDVTTGDELWATSGLAAKASMAGLLRILPKDFAGPWLTAELSLPLLAFTVAVALGSGLLFSLAPALQSTRPNLAGTLRSR